MKNWEKKPKDKNGIVKRWVRDIEKKKLIKWLFDKKDKAKKWLKNKTNYFINKK